MNSKKFDNWYEIYENGTVCSLQRQIGNRWFDGKTLKPRLNNGRGMQVHCRLSTGEDRYLYVAKLVYCAFCTKGNEDILSLYDSLDDDVIVHNDGDLTNNHYTNLSLGNRGVILNEAVARNKARIKVNKDE